MRLALLALAILATGCNLLPRTGSKGTMPPPGPNGEVDPSAMPDFIAVAGDVGEVGWVEKAAVTDPADRVWPVYADDLTTVVGQLVPGRGFVPAGVDPNAVPTIDVQVAPVTPGIGGTGNVTVYVRNCGSEMVWVGVVSDGQAQAIGAGGYWPNGYVGGGDFVVPTGAQLVIFDRSPSEPGAAPRQRIYAGGSAAEPVTRWVNVERSGNAVVGEGVPAWWQGVNAPC
jgi:hypothetical protein